MPPQRTLPQALTRALTFKRQVRPTWVTKLQPSQRRRSSLEGVQPFMALESIPAHTAFLSGAAGVAYNEAAFRHFLGIERRRVERSERSLLLVLVSLRTSPGRIDTLPSDAAAALFAALGSTVREVDFVGWYREGRVAAAVMAQTTASPIDSRARVADRVAATLRDTALADLPLRVRVATLRGGRTA